MAGSSAFTPYPGQRSEPRRGGQGSDGSLTFPAGSVTTAPRPRRLAGDDDAPTVLLLSEEPHGAAPVPLSEDDAASGNPPVTVTVGAGTQVLPAPGSHRLDQFVEAVYLLHGWAGVDQLVADLAALVDDRLHPVRALQSTELTLGVAQRTKNAVESSRRGLARRVLTVGCDLEAALKAQAVGMLDRSQRRLDAVASVFFDLREPSVYLRRHRALQSSTGWHDDAFTQLRGAVDRLQPAAHDFLAAHLAWMKVVDTVEAERTMTGRASAASEERIEKAALARCAAEGALAAARLRESSTQEGRVIPRFTNGELIVPPPHAVALRQRVYAILRSSQQAIDTARGRLTTPLARLDARDAAAHRRPESVVVEAWDASVWRLRKLVPMVTSQADVQDPGPHAHDGALLDALWEGIEAGLANEARVALVRHVALTAFTMALHVVCPPVGLAFDAGLSSWQVADVYAQYSDASADWWTDLDPRLALGACEPDAARVGMEVVGALVGSLLAFV